MNDEVQLLFHELADLPQGERERVFQERGVAAATRAEVESLLRFDSTDPELFAECVSGAAMEMLASTESESAADFGPYRIVRLLGVGGMGSVYLAERIDGEISQKVAIKLLRADDHPSVWRNRFLTERQLLASLNHPSIVRVLDAGHTEDGRPYLVMEYVEGEPIDVYAARIGVRQRLLLFLQVCEGVSHAHGHLIIHRDLKPSNILVDGSGQPKLLDFGIAKLLDETRDPTQTMERMLSVNYASPEQLHGGSQTTATDVYSLGAVLYKLLTGRSPHETENRTSRAFEVVAGVRQVAAASRVNPSLPADIDFILRKALRLESEARYASVEAFANDVRALLESRPVAARSGDAWYRTRKSLRRHWVPASAATLAAISLTAGLVYAEHERAVAERRFQQVRQLAGRLIDVDKDIRLMPGATKARARIVSSLLEYLQPLAAAARGDAELALEIGSAYQQVARVQGVPVNANLGQLAEAEESLRQADGLLALVLKATPGDRRALLTAAIIAHDRMTLAGVQNRWEEALLQARRAAEQLDRLAAAGPLQESEVKQAAFLYSNVAVTQQEQHQLEDAIRHARRAMEISRPVEGARGSLSLSSGILALSLREMGDLDGALNAIRESRQTQERLTQNGEVWQQHNLGLAFYREGLILGEKGDISLNRDAEAAAVLERALSIGQAIEKADPRDSAAREFSATVARQLANVVRESDPARGLAIYDHALTSLRESGTGNVVNRRLEAGILAESSYAARRLHRDTDARHRIDRALQVLRDIGDYPSAKINPASETDLVLRALAAYSADTGDLRKAAEISQDLLGRILASNPDPLRVLRDAVHVSRLYETLGALRRRMGDAREAADMAARSLEIWERWDRNIPGNAFVRRQLTEARAQR